MDTRRNDILQVAGFVAHSPNSTAKLKERALKIQRQNKLMFLYKGGQKGKEDRAVESMRVKKPYEKGYIPK